MHPHLPDPLLPRSLVVLVWAFALAMLLPSGRAQADELRCDRTATDACYFSFQPLAAPGQMHYYASRDASASPAVPAPVAALIALHGHPRDAGKTFNAALLAVRQAAALDTTLVVAPLFQVGADHASRCQTPGVPTAQTGDLLWTCQSWVDGGASLNGDGLTAFTALDALVGELQRQWPSLRTVTVAGFSAGAQLVQHYIGFAAARPAGGPSMRYVVADPGSWLYFDAVRPQTMLNGAATDWAACGAGAAFPGGCSFEFNAPPTSCTGIDRWKYGTGDLPITVGRTAAEARAHYAAADVSYLAGALDSSDARGTFYGILDKSCAAQAQGPYRLQRAAAYAAYDRVRLAPSRLRPLVVVPGCAHDVACVFPSDAARAVLLGTR